MNKDAHSEREFVKCLTCERAAKARGLCDGCRQQARRAIRLGKVTEAELVERGLMLPDARPGAFTSALEQNAAEPAERS